MLDTETKTYNFKGRTCRTYNDLGKSIELCETEADCKELLRLYSECCSSAAYNIAFILNQMNIPERFIMWTFMREEAKAQAGYRSVGFM